MKTNTDFAKSLELDYPILSDPDRTVAKAYGLLAPGRNNPQRWTFVIGKDGKILHIDRSVKSARHGEDIAQKLEELGVARRQ